MCISRVTRRVALTRPRRCEQLVFDFTERRWTRRPSSTSLLFWHAQLRQSRSKVSASRMWAPQVGFHTSKLNASHVSAPQYGRNATAGVPLAGPGVKRWRAASTGRGSPPDGKLLGVNRGWYAGRLIYLAFKTERFLKATFTIWI